jgi:hypothetical protein
LPVDNVEKAGLDGLLSLGVEIVSVAELLSVTLMFEDHL